MNIQKTAKKAFAVAAIAFAASVILPSCTRYYTPEKAASTGGKKCSKRNAVW